METAPPRGSPATGDPVATVTLEQAALAEAAGAIAATGDLDAALRALFAGVRELLPVDTHELTNSRTDGVQISIR